MLEVRRERKERRRGGERRGEDRSCGGERIDHGEGGRKRKKARKQ